MVKANPPVTGLRKEVKKFETNTRPKDIAKQATPQQEEAAKLERSQLDGADSTSGRSEISATSLIT